MRGEGGCEKCNILNRVGDDIWAPVGVGRCRIKVNIWGVYRRTMMNLHCGFHCVCILIQILRQKVDVKKNSCHPDLILLVEGILWVCPFVTPGYFIETELWYPSPVIRIHLLLVRFCFQLWITEIIASARLFVSLCFGPIG